MRQISFKYYMQLQTRFLIYQASRLHISELEAAGLYAAKLRYKIEQKYIILF